MTRGEAPGGSRPGAFGAIRLRRMGWGSLQPSCRERSPPSARPHRRCATEAGGQPPAPFMGLAGGCPRARRRKLRLSFLALPRSADPRFWAGLFSYIITHPQQAGEKGVCPARLIRPADGCRTKRGANEMTAGDRESRETEGKPYGRALWLPETKAKLFAFVKETTAVVKATTGILERVGSVKSDATIALYRRLARSRVQVTAKGAGRLMDGVTAQSWHTTRAAVLYQLADECRRWRGVTDRTLDLAEAVDAAKRARHAVLAYRQVLAMTRPEPEKAASVEAVNAAPYAVAARGLRCRDQGATCRCGCYVGHRMPARRDRARGHDPA